MKNILIITLLFLMSSQILGGTKTISIDFELSETAINRAIVSQFNEPNYPFKHFTGQFTLNGVPNVTYSVELARPTIEIGNNTIGIHMALTFNATVGGVEINREIDITPSLIVNETSISGSSVVAYLDDLDDKINATNMEWEIKALLIGLYNTFTPQIYAKDLFDEVLDEINSNEFIAQRAFSITDIGIATSFNAGKFVVKASVELTYSTTSFYSKFGYNTGDDFIRFGSNIDCKVVRVIVHTSNGQVYKNENLNIELNYNPNYDFDYYGELNLGNAVTSIQAWVTWYVLYKTNNTFYFNKYYGSPNNWTLPQIKMNY